MQDDSYDDADDLPTPRTMIVVTIEGLGSNLVGCYGASICPTPFWDSFASKAIVFDQFWSDSLSPQRVLQSMWTGTHVASRDNAGSADNESCDAIREDFIQVSELSDELFSRAMLITDSDAVANGFADQLFGDVASLAEDQPNEEEQLEPPVSTAFANLVEKALGLWAERMDELPILWIHSRGLNGPWDAPYEFRQMMCDEGDPDPPHEVAPPNLQVKQDTDPDEVFGHACSAGGQAIAFDSAWEFLEDAIEQIGIAENCMLTLAGVDGYPLGEHGWVGTYGESLYCERLHVPLIVRPGREMELGIRVPQIVQPHGLIELWGAWMEQDNFSVDASDFIGGLFAPDAPSQWPSQRQYALSIHKDQTHLVVPGWSGRWSKNRSYESDSHANETTGLFAAEERVELYAFPDDRWQQNEIGMRASTVVETLTIARDKVLQQLSNPEAIGSVNLDEQLVTPDR